jgi:hypothetical protein
MKNRFGYHLAGNRISLYEEQRWESREHGWRVLVQVKEKEGLTIRKRLKGRSPRKENNMWKSPEIQSDSLEGIEAKRDSRPSLLGNATF